MFLHRKELIQPVNVDTGVSSLSLERCNAAPLSLLRLPLKLLSGLGFLCRSRGQAPRGSESLCPSWAGSACYSIGQLQRSAPLIGDWRPARGMLDRRIEDPGRCVCIHSHRRPPMRSP
jgi:hypothetical protein